MSKSKPIPSALLAKVKTTDKKRFIQDYNEANFVLDIIKEAIEARIQGLEDKQEAELIFDKPGVYEYHISLIGQRKMAKKILNLFP